MISTQPSENNTGLVRRAIELRWGPAPDRLESLAGDPAMQHMLGMLATQREIHDRGDTAEIARLHETWAAEWQASTTDLTDRGFTGLEMGTIFAVALMPDPEAPTRES